MTCIVAVKGIDKIVLAGESAGVSGLNVCIRRDPKVFSIKNFTMGVTGSFRMGQLLMNSLKVAPQGPKQTDYQFMTTTFIDAVRKCFKKGGFITITDDQEEGGDFLVIYRNEIYHIESDFQVRIPNTPYDSAGCGEDYALGALMGMSLTDNQQLLQDPETACRNALIVATELSAGVRPPYNLIVVRNTHHKRNSKNK